MIWEGSTLTHFFFFFFGIFLGVFYLIVNCPETYPDSTPQLELTLQHPLDSSLSTEFELTDPLCPSPEKLEKLNEWLLNELKLQHTPGLVVIYTMITGLQEEMRGLLKLDLDELQAKETERLLEEERKEAKKFYGTPVTREGFLAWQKKFFSENPAFNFQQNSAEGKLTGRQLFEKDKTLVSSDSVLLGEDDECFDPSSFSEAELNFLDNLNLQDEEESALVTQLLLQSHE
ncbi:hypothetical protein HMI56_002343 [Coelomomyces lativittatus]|nr:hypothetical protein HMI56_002343 [Coelomomyces lativittatus]